MIQTQRLEKAESAPLDIEAAVPIEQATAALATHDRAEPKVALLLAAHAYLSQK
jgi:hypothetical protein